MCHEATSVGLPESIGIGKGTVLLEDFDATDAIFVIGQHDGAERAASGGSSAARDARMVASVGSSAVVTPPARPW